MENKKSYYAIIPANVRYCKNLIPNAKLLYGEITALCNEKGYCWASNSYFSELYEVSEKTISVWISQLVSYKFISRELKYKEGTKEIENRWLRINGEGIEDKVITPILDNVNTPIPEKVIDNNTTLVNNTLYNNTINNTVESSRFLITTDIGQKLWKGIETDIRDEKTKNDVAKNQSPRVDYKDDRIEKAFKRFKDYKKDEFKFRYKSPTSEQTAVNNLIELCCGNFDNAEKIVDISISNGWKGLFALNKKQKEPEPYVSLEDHIEKQYQKMYGNQGITINAEVVK